MKEPTRTSFFIYVLIDPRNDEIRYVGYTYNLKNRLWNHIGESRKQRNIYKSRWINSLLKLGFIPEIKSIDTATDADVIEKEKFWIAEMKRQGCRLTNLSEGGRGCLGYRQTPEAIEKTIAALKGVAKSPEHRKKLSDVHRGMKASEDARRKMSQAHIGRRQSSTAIEKTRQAHIGTKRALEAILKQRAKWATKTSKFPRGVRPELERINTKNKWSARASFGCKRFYVGVFETIEEAAKAVERREQELIASYGARQIR